MVDWLRRWGSYLLVGLAVFGVGSNSLLGSAAALAGWTVLPLLWTVAQAPPWVAGVLIGQVLLAAGLVWGAQALLWPVAWRAAEKALPLAPAALRASDAAVVALALLPLELLQFIGLVAWWHKQPAWLATAWAGALAAWVLVSLGSVLAGMAVLQVLRQPPRVVRARRALMVRPGAPALRLLTAAQALLVLPMCRGPARRTGRTWCLGGAALLAMAVGLWCFPNSAGWWLAAFAASALLATTRLRALIGLELVPLAAAAVALPVAPQHWRRLHAGLALAPVVLGLAGLLLALPWAKARPVMVLVYCAACVATCGLEAASRLGPPADKAARWLVSMVLLLAVSSEVMA